MVGFDADVATVAPEHTEDAASNEALKDDTETGGTKD